MFEIIFDRREKVLNPLKDNTFPIKDVNIDDDDDDDDNDDYDHHDNDGDE